MTHAPNRIPTLRVTTIFVFLLTAITQAFAATPCTLDRATGTTIDPKPYLTNAYGSRWNAATNRIVFMSPNADGYYRLFTQRPDGTSRFALTANTPGLPPGHQGTAYWHPSGRYILFIAKNLTGTIAKCSAIQTMARFPASAVTTTSGSSPPRPPRWQLTDEPNTKDQGVLIPVFSPDGKRIAWSARQPGGKYA